MREFWAGLWSIWGTWPHCACPCVQSGLALSAHSPLLPLVTQPRSSRAFWVHLCQQLLPAVTADQGLPSLHPACTWMRVRDHLQPREPPAQLPPSLDLLLSHCLPEPHPWPEHRRLCGLLSQPCPYDWLCPLWSCPCQAPVPLCIPEGPPCSSMQWRGVARQAEIWGGVQGFGPDLASTGAKPLMSPERYYCAWPPSSLLVLSSAV